MVLFRAVSVISEQSELERPLSTTSQQSTSIPSSKKQQAFGVVNHVLKIIESLDENQRTSLRGLLQRTTVDLKRGSSIETVKENNNKLVKEIMGLELLITTDTTYYDMISQIENSPTLIIKEKRSTKQKTTSPLIKLSDFTP
jgi:hypothetical protein